MSDAIPIAMLVGRLEQLEAQVEIRAVMADYMRLCDRLDASTPMDELGELFTHDAAWVGAGARYEAAFGASHGRETIIAMLERFRTPPHFAFNAHYLTSEKIVVNGDAAVGEWMMLQTSTYMSGTSDLRSARLGVRFLRRQSRWRIRRFETENLFSRPVDRWNDPAPMPVPAGA